MKKKYVLDDITGLVAIYSLRLLRKEHIYKPIIRIRRASDNAEIDIYADLQTSYIDLSSIYAFTSNLTAYISIIYDQSGNNNNAVQATTAEQGYIRFFNKNLGINFDQGQRYVAPYATGLNSINMSAFVRFDHDDSVGGGGGSNQGLITTTKVGIYGDGYCLMVFNSVYTYKVDANYYDGFSQETGKPKTMSIVGTNAGTTRYCNGTQVGTSPAITYATAGNTDLGLGTLYANNSSQFLDGRIYEAIVFNRAVTDEERRYIETNLYEFKR